MYGERRRAAPGSMKGRWKRCAISPSPSEFVSRSIGGDATELRSESTTDHWYRIEVNGVVEIASQTLRRLALAANAELAFRQ